MALYEITENALQKVDETTFREESIQERQTLQRLLRDQIEIISPDTMVLAEEYGDWEDSRRRIDLLCLDRSGRLVVVELKRTEDGGHMELQAVRYAAMVSKMTFASAVQAHKAYLEKRGFEGDAEERLLEFLGWEEPNEEDFANEVAIVLASQEFSKELTTTVIWLGEHDIDVRCVRLKPYRNDDQILLDVQQIFPLPEAADYQVRIREKEREERHARSQQRDTTRFDLTIGERTLANLPKRRLIFHVVKEAISRGAMPQDVLLKKRSWVILPGEHDSDSFVSNAQNVGNRSTGSSPSEVRRYFFHDEELFHAGGQTFAMSRRSGPETRPEVDRIIKDFNLDDMSYAPA